MALDLSGLTVYTEAATGSFASTAALAVAGGAETVYAFADDSSYGTVKEAHEHTKSLVSAVGSTEPLALLSEKRPEEIGEADVITNTGFVRPIDETMVSWMKPTAAVPLMFEPWEFREDDIAIEACWKHGIPVLGTDESDERVQTQSYLGALAMKLAFECELEVFNGSYVVVGGGQMALSVVETLDSMDAEVTMVASEINADGVAERRDTRYLNDEIAQTALKTADGLILIEHAQKGSIIGPTGQLSAVELADINEHLTIIHICGAVDEDALERAGLLVYPENPAPAGKMTVTTGYLGPQPVVDLHAAGLKVGEELARRRLEGKDLEATLSIVRGHSLAKDFGEDFYAERNQSPY